MEDFYKVLELDRTATQDAIKAAYRRLSSLWHPDRHSNSPQSHAKMAAINIAYQVLGDPAARKEYDESGEHGVEGRLKAEARGLLLQLMEDLLNQTDRDDIIRAMHESLEKSLGDLNNKLPKIHQVLERHKAIRKNLKKQAKNKDNSFLVYGLERRIEKIKADLKAANEHKKRITFAQELLAEYELEDMEIVDGWTITTNPGLFRTAAAFK